MWLILLFLYVAMVWVGSEILGGPGFVLGNLLFLALFFGGVKIFDLWIDWENHRIRRGKIN